MPQIGFEGPLSVVMFKKHWTNPHYHNPQYKPTDYTGSFRIGRRSLLTGSQSTQIMGDVVVPRNRIIRAVQRRLGFGKQEKAPEMFYETELSPIAQFARGKIALQQAMWRPVHNPTRKQKLTAYTNPLQDVIGPFDRNRQVNTPSAQRAYNRGTTQIQPSLKVPAPQGNIPTSAPWNNQF